MGRQEQGRSNVQAEGLVSDRSINSSSIIIGGKQEYMGTDAGKVMAVGRCGVSFDGFLSS